MKKVFTEVFMLIYYNFKLLIKMKTDAFIIVIIKILSQQSAIDSLMK